MTDVPAGGSHPAHSTVNGSPFPPIGEVDRARALCEKLLSYPSLRAGTAASPDQSAGAGR